MLFRMFCKAFMPLALSLVLTAPAHALVTKSTRITVPDYAKIETSTAIRVVHKTIGERKIYFGKTTVLPLPLTVLDMFGAHITVTLSDPNQIKHLSILPEVVTGGDPNPVNLYSLPLICSRTELVKNNDNYTLVYNAANDLLNKQPSLQLVDPDARRNPVQRQILRHFDGQNTLRLNAVTVRYDYEDNSILDFQGPHPITGEPHMVYEGQGGFYANFHYAIVPYDPRLDTLTRQELLSFAQGKLHDIDREDLTPLVRVHSFLPGPYQSNYDLYPLCEWGDTSFQAKSQNMNYENFEMWDWDLLSTLEIKNEKISLIVWEGDEEDWMIAGGLLDPFYLTDDLVGVFHIERTQTAKPMRLQNAAQNFEIEVFTP